MNGGAIVCWGPQQRQRQDALNRLKQVLQSAKDLPEYVKQLDAEAAKTGQDSPILRKAIAQVFQAQRKLLEAAAQFELAIQLQPGDKELYEGLAGCFGDNEHAIQILLRIIQVDPHSLKRYEELADHLKDDPAQAERAITSLIEAGATEAENHAALAEYRQKQNRWDEAIGQWSEVAKLRALEPNGLVRLAEAQLHQKQWDAARATIEKLQRTEWPSRFNDVANQTRRLQDQLPK
jgi:tetratricopeptide (TPR) repeat protein